jgi:hypothetical protein
MGAGMKAEIVRADEIKAGDRIYDWQTEEIQTVNSIYESAILRGWLISRCDKPGFSYENHPESLVCRILPEPVEEQEFWRVRYEHYRDTPDGKGFYARFTEASPTKEIAIKRYRRRHPDSGKTVSFAKDATIEHVRETIISREEVRP